MDGAGLTRAYSHRVRGSQAVLIVWSLAINESIMMIWHHVSVFPIEILSHNKVTTILKTNVHSIFTLSSD